MPYDITKVALVADVLESSWHRMLLMTNRQAAERNDAFRTRVRGLLVARLRKEIAELGAGPAIPDFKLTTKQRRK